MGLEAASPRFDVIALSEPAIPIVGDVARLTLAPIVSRLIWPLMMLEIFGPHAVPRKLAGFPKEMAVRSSQIDPGVADALNKRGVRSATGGKCHRSAVRNLLASEILRSLTF